MALRFDEQTGTLVPCHTDPPPGARAKLRRRSLDEITIIIPGRPRLLWLLPALVVVAAVASGLIPWEQVYSLDWPFIVFGLGFVAVLVGGVFNSFGKTVVRFDPERFSISKRLYGLRWSRSGSTSRIKAISIIDRNEGKKDEGGRDYPAEEMIEIRTPWSYYRFGKALRPADRLWVFRELQVFLRDIGHPVD